MQCVSTSEQGREFWEELKAAGKYPREPKCRLCRVQLRDDAPAPYYAILSFEDGAAVFLAICRACGESLQDLLRGTE